LRKNAYKYLLDEFIERCCVNVLLHKNHIQQKQAYRPSFLMTTVCLFFIFSPVYQPVPTVIYTSEKIQEVSKGGCAALGSGFPIGASNTLLAHDFPDNSEVFVRKV